MSKSCPFSLYQIRESGLLPTARTDELEHLLETTPVPATKPDGTPFPNLLIVPTTQGESAFLVDRPHAKDYMHKCMLAYFLTEEETQLIHSTWISALREQRFQRKVEKAKAEGNIIPEDQWHEGVFHGDTYYSNIDDFHDQVEPDEIPKYLEATTTQPVVPSLHADDILEDIIANRGWEDMELTELNGTADLQAALDAFVAANTQIVAHFPDPRKLIQLNPSKA